MLEKVPTNQIHIGDMYVVVFINSSNVKVDPSVNIVAMFFNVKRNIRCFTKYISFAKES